MCVCVSECLKSVRIFSPWLCCYRKRGVVEKTYSQKEREREGGKGVSPGPFLQEMLFPPLSEFLLRFRLLLFLHRRLLVEGAPWMLRKSEDSFGGDLHQTKKIFFTFHVLTFNWWLNFHQRRASSHFLTSGLPRSVLLSDR